MKTRTNPKTKIKTVSLEGYEKTRLAQAADVCFLFAGEGIAEATAALAAIGALLVKLTPPTRPDGKTQATLLK